MTHETLFDLAVIGAGPGGYHAAIRGAQLGLNVAIIEQDDGSGIGGLGGVCLNWGCIPSKALLKNAELLNHLNHPEEWGFSFTNFEASMQSAVERSRTVSKRLTDGVGYLLRKNKITLIKGHGRLLSSTQIAVDGADTVLAKYIVIATGARPLGLPGMELNGETIISSRQALELKEKPKAIAIVGASAIGCEFAYYFNAYGVEVLLLEALERIVPKEDVEVSQELERQFVASGIKVSTAARVTSVANGKQPIVSYETAGGSHTFSCDKVLLGVGVRPNSDDLGLEQVGVTTTKGFIQVDGLMQTNVAGVHAVGDITGKLPLAHVAFDQGIVAAEAIAGKRPRPIEDYTAMPRCTYCQPEIASIGLTEQDARDRGIDVLVGKAPFLAAGKAVAINDSDGFVKIVTDAATGEVIGAHIIGPGATELIGEIGMLRYLEGTSTELHRLTHAHPTLSEAVKEAAGAVTGHAIHF